VLEPGCAHVRTDAPGRARPLRCRRSVGLRPVAWRAVKTRTLLLLAVTCGIAILVAGTVQLLRVADQKTSTVEVDAGEVGKAGDATVVLDDITVDDGHVVATLTIGGVDDAKGLAGFTMVAAGTTRDVRGGTCTGFTESAQQCTIEFDNTNLKGSTRLLLFNRAGDKLRWTLAQ